MTTLNLELAGSGLWAQEGAWDSHEESGLEGLRDGLLLDCSGREGVGAQLDGGQQSLYPIGRKLAGQRDAGTVPLCGEGETNGVAGGQRAGDQRLGRPAEPEAASCDHSPLRGHPPPLPLTSHQRAAPN